MIWLLYSYVVQQHFTNTECHWPIVKYEFTYLCTCDLPVDIVYRDWLIYSVCACHFFGGIVKCVKIKPWITFQASILQTAGERRLEINNRDQRAGAMRAMLIRHKLIIDYM